jgi:tetratricopeptide (TPR) repeat protein/ssDNA-binding Zn-finger/Zn-ribbon topoisomerase 1
MRRMSLPRLSVLILPLAALAACGGPEDGPSAGDSEAAYVGRESCAECHPVEHELWQGSHHDLAMEPADETTVLGDFDDATFTHYGVTSDFFRQGDTFMVRTEGPDGQLAEYEVAYTFGFDPLQQYLAKLPNGRMQTLPLCWDTRPAADGGQRWFHIYPDEPIPPDDVLHWTGPAQNWNHMCAECHSTNVRKNYHAAEDHFETTFSEVDVSCEACHGPGSLHVEWARDGHREGDPRLVGSVTDSVAVVWTIEPDADTAKRSVRRTSQAELETCARCHSRRAMISEDWVPGQSLMNTHRPALLTEELYHADGQILDEVYVWGSFLQSKMYREGVTCTDCHEPHAARVLAQGNALCGKCHLASKFDMPSHHFHKEGSTGASCVECHMPASTYMVVDPRRDHSLRIPRPDLSVRLGTPNACNVCHADSSYEWAAAAAEEWWGPVSSDEPAHWAETIHAARTWQAGAGEKLVRLAADRSAPAIVRATAVMLLPRDAGAKASDAIQVALNDEDPLVRMAALGLLDSVDPMPRMQIGYRHLSDPVRSVRLEAASTLASVPPGLLPEEQRTKLDEVLEEYRAVQELNADRAEAHLNLGSLHARRGELDEAIREYRIALEIMPSFGPAWVNLADVYRQRGHEAEAERKLRAALEAVPEPADIHLALGLSLVRRGRRAEALAQFEMAAQLQPDEPYYQYVLSVALHSSGDGEAAKQILTGAHDRFPGHPDIAAFLAQLQNGP